MKRLAVVLVVAGLFGVDSGSALANPTSLSLGRAERAIRDYGHHDTHRYGGWVSLATCQRRTNLTVICTLVEHNTSLASDGLAPGPWLVTFPAAIATLLPDARVYVHLRYWLDSHPFSEPL